MSSTQNKLTTFVITGKTGTVSPLFMLQHTGVHGADFRYVAIPFPTTNCIMFPTKHKAQMTLGVLQSYSEQTIGSRELFYFLQNAKVQEVELVFNLVD